MFARGLAIAAFFIRKCEIEVNVGMRGQRAGGADEMLDSRVKISLFFEDAAEVVAGDAVRRIELNGGLKSGAGFFRFTHLVENHAKVDVASIQLGARSSACR